MLSSSRTPAIKPANASTVSVSGLAARARA
jgi:hypothetical protein